jgi:hypothetical protein
VELFPDSHRPPPMLGIGLALLAATIVLGG